MVNFSFGMLINNIVFSSLAILIIFALKKSILKNASERFNYYVWLPLNIIMLFPLQITIIKKVENSTLENKFVNIVNSANSGLRINEAIKELDKIDFLSYIPKIYICIAIILIIISVSKYFFDKVMLIKTSSLVEDNEINDIFINELSKLKITKYMPLRVNKDITTPINIGIFRPYIVLPNYKYSKRELELIFKHELIHYLKSDFQFKFLVMINRCIYWCNPLISFMIKDINYYCEVCCDREVVDSLESKEEIKEYGLIIIKTDSKDYHKNNSLVLGLNNKSITKDRITLLFSDKKDKFGNRAIAIASVTMICTFLISIITINTEVINVNAANIINSIVEQNHNESNLSTYVDEFKELINSENSKIDDVGIFIKKAMDKNDIKLVEDIFRNSDVKYTTNGNVITGQYNMYYFRIDYNTNDYVVATI